LPTDETTVGVERFMNYNVYGLLTKPEQIGPVEAGMKKDIYLWA